MPDFINDVAKFHKAMKQPVATVPGHISKDRALLRHRLINEEYNEFVKGWCNNNLPEIVDALCDLIYVTVGAGLEYVGPECFAACWQAVQKSNMAKVGGPVAEDGKQLKPSGWVGPDIAGIIAKYQK